MRPNRLVIKIIAFALIVLLSQKIGFGIYFHNAQHIQASASKSDERSIDYVNFHCNCIDDFLMPFAETNSFVPTAINIHNSIFPATPIEELPNHFQFFNSPRAPPVSFS